MRNLGVVAAGLVVASATGADAALNSYLTLKHRRTTSTHNLDVRIASSDSKFSLESVSAVSIEPASTDADAPKPALDSSSGVALALEKTGEAFSAQGTNDRDPVSPGWEYQLTFTPLCRDGSGDACGEPATLAGKHDLGAEGCVHITDDMWVGGSPPETGLFWAYDGAPSTRSRALKGLSWDEPMEVPFAVMEVCVFADEDCDSVGGCLDVVLSAKLDVALPVCVTTDIPTYAPPNPMHVVGKAYRNGAVRTIDAVCGDIRSSSTWRGTFDMEESAEGDDVNAEGHSYVVKVGGRDVFGNAVALDAEVIVVGYEECDDENVVRVGEDQDCDRCAPPTTVITDTYPGPLSVTAGEIVLCRRCTLDGDVTVDGGTLRLFESAGTGDIHVSGGARLEFEGHRQKGGLVVKGAGYAHYQVLVDR